MPVTPTSTCDADHPRNNLLAKNLSKCARGGCPNRRLEEGDFCLSCVASGRSKMRSASVCDELAALPDPRPTT